MRLATARNSPQLRKMPRRGVGEHARSQSAELGGRLADSALPSRALRGVDLAGCGIACMRTTAAVPWVLRVSNQHPGSGMSIMDGNTGPVIGGVSPQATGNFFVN